MKPIGEILNEIGWPARLRDLATRVDRNVPNDRKPEAFHEEKSEIAHELRQVGRELERAG